MTIIEASSVSVKTMADGTLRVSMDVEPRHAQAAFALFGAPGTPMALAALKTATHAAPEPVLKEGPKRERMPPALEFLVYRCQEQEFIDWVAAKENYRYAMTPDECALVVKRWCGVKSRKDIDGDPRALALFDQKVRGPWQEHQRKAAVRA